MSSNNAGGIGREGDFVVIRLHESEVHSFRVALSECPCKAAKSSSSKGIRQRLVDALAKVTA